MTSQALLAAGLAALTASCSMNIGDCIAGEGPTQSREIELTGDFSKLTNDASLDVDVRYGTTPSVTVYAPANHLDAVLVRQSGNTLTIDTESGCYTNTDWRAEVVTTGLSEIENDGSGEITATDLRGRSGAFRLHADGSGEIELDGLTDVRKLSAETGGSGDIRLGRLDALETLSVECSGSGGVGVRDAVDVERLTVTLEGSGGADLREVRAREADVVTGGSGSARVNVVDRLDADSGGSGSIRYLGNPGQLTTNESGSGSVRQANR